MTCELLIDGLAAGGKGVGRFRGKVVFVPMTAPGDRVLCRILREKKRYAEGEVIELIAPGPGRREAKCPVFGLCGGCQWQHLEYPDQCRWKERIFSETLRRQLGDAQIAPSPLVAAPDAWHYRSRVQFKCRQTEDGFVMGFYRRGSHFVIDLHECPVAGEKINRTLELFRRWLPDSPCPERIPQVDMAVDDGGRVRVVVHLIGGDSADLRAYLEPRANAADLGLWLQCGRKETLQPVCGPEDLEIRPMEDAALLLGYGPGGFAQINLEQNRRLVAEVLELAALQGRERVLDLFCGMGNFSLPLARHAAEVVGVEDFAPSIASARDNARRNGFGNTEFHARPAEGAAGTFSRAGGFDLVVLDPPRSGAYGVARELATVRPPRIIYVSCDPATMARDLKPLVHSSYRLLHARPFDLFPHTAHIEGVVMLERSE